MRGDYGEDPPPPSQLLSDKRMTARQAHVCGGCRRTIEIGERYRRVFGLFDGEPFFGKLCRDCQTLE